MSIASAVGIATGATWHRTLETIVRRRRRVVFVVPDMFDGYCAPPLTPFFLFLVYFGA